jgi:hypothetical protein
MIEPKKDIYTILSGIEGVNVYQARPEIEVVYPCIIFYVSGNTPEYVLEKDIGYQDIEVTIDIYDKTSKESGLLLGSLESAMLKEGYRMTYCTDVPNDVGSHITTRFNLVV